MQGRSSPSLLFVYFGMVATAFAVIAVGLTAVVKASTSLSQASAREKTLLELQVESSRQIRQALTTPVTAPPLPPITARPARDLREAAATTQETKPARTKPKLPPAAMNAMAMDQSGANRPSGSNYYPVIDRHTQF
jgi:hypothetical protein